MTAGLYCSSMGTEKRSVTFSTTMPTVAVCPGLRLSAAGSKRILGPAACGGGATAGAAAFAGGGAGFVATTGVAEGANEAAPGPGAWGAGFDAGALTSNSRLTAGRVSVPEYRPRKF